nr:hypothetical protein [Streptomyces atratus]
MAVESLSELPAPRADRTSGSHSLTRDDYRVIADAVGAVADFDSGATAWRRRADWRRRLGAGHRGAQHVPGWQPSGGPVIETVWWVNQELLHHGAEIALLRDLFRARQR